MMSLPFTVAGVYVAFGLSAFLQAFTTAVRARRSRAGVAPADRESEDAIRWVGVGVALEALAGLLVVLHSLPR